MLNTVIFRVDGLVHVAVTVPMSCENENRFKTLAFDSEFVVPLNGWFVDSENSMVKTSPAEYPGVFDESWMVKDSIVGPSFTSVVTAD